MGKRRRASLGPIIFPIVVIVVMVALAVIIHDGVWMTAALVVGLIALVFLIIALFNRLPPSKD